MQHTITTQNAFTWQNTFAWIKLAFASLSSLIGLALGGFDKLIIVLIIFTILDVITGIIKSFICKSDKTHRGGFSSQEMSKGSLRKILIFIVVSLAVLIDSVVFHNKQVLRNVIIFYYIATEGMSIMENISLCGVKYPPQLQRIFEQLKEQETPKIGEMLIKKGLITQEDLDKTLNEQEGKEKNKRRMENG